MPALHKVCSVAVIATLALGLGAATVMAQGASARQVSAAAQKMDKGHVYLLRGLANIWSRGMDTLAEQLDAKGVRWSIHNHKGSKALAAEAIEKYKKDRSFGPIIIVGHSLGADAATLMAEQIGREGVPVRLLVTFDGVARQDATQRKGDSRQEAPDPFSRVSANVGEVLNFYISTGWGREMLPGRNFKGKIENVDLKDVPRVSHLNIDKQPDLHARAVERILSVLNESGRRSARN